MPRYLITSLLLILPGLHACTDTRQLHDSMFTVDTHVDILRIEEAGDKDYLSEPDVQVDIVKLEQGGLDAVFFILFAEQREWTPAGYAAAREEALARYATIERMLTRHPDRIELARSVADAERIHADGRLVAFLGMENGFPLAGDPANLQQYYDLGVRYLGLLHMGHNTLGDSADPDRDRREKATVHGGLTPAGRAIVAEANRLGVMVDVSHAHRDTAIEMARISRAPVIASHSSSRRLVNISRNMDDEQMLAVRDSGGVVQIVAFNTYVKNGSRERIPAIIKLARELELPPGRPDPEALPPDIRARYEAGMAEINEKYPPVTASVGDYVDHIDYAVELIGIDHVGIASDFGGGGGVEGWQDASETPNVTAELVARGYRETDIRKLWGGNLLRVFADVERLAER